MDSSQNIFIVPALNSFHAGARTKSEARKRYDIINTEKPKLPSLFNRKDNTAATQFPSRVVMRTSVLKNRASISEALVSNTVNVATRPTGIRVQPFVRRPVGQTALTKSSLPPPVEVKAVVASTEKAQASTAPKNEKSVRYWLRGLRKTEDRNDKAINAKETARLEASPDTPSPAAETTPIPRSEQMKFPKVGGIPRSTVMPFPKSRPGVATESNTPRLESQPKVLRAPVKPVVAFKPTRLLSPKPQLKVVRRSGPVNRSSNSAVRETVTKTTPAMPTLPLGAPIKTEDDKFTEEMEVKVKTPIQPQSVKAVPNDGCSDASINEASTTTEKTAVPETVQAQAHEEPEIEVISQLEAETADEKDNNVMSSEIIESIEAVDTSVQDEIPSHTEDTSVELCKEIEEATCSNANPTFAKFDSPPKSVRFPMMDELKTALERRKENMVFKEPLATKAYKKETIINQRRPLAVKSITVNREEKPKPTTAQPVVATAVASGIQARIAAMYGSAGVNGTRAPIVTGARVCQFKIPELLESDKASKDARIQREVDALRTLNKVGTNSAALVKTRAFGGREPHNAAANTVQEGRALPLHCKSVVDRIKREQSQRMEN